MRLGIKTLLVVGLIATVIAVGFWVARVFQSPVADTAPEVDTASGPVNTGTSPPRTSVRQIAPAIEPPAPNPATTLETTTVMTAASPPISDWEDKIHDVLSLEAAPSEVGKKFLELLPHLPSEGRIAALEHAANLLADADYEPMGKLFTDPKISEDEIEILMRDVLNRANAIKLPLLLQVARTPDHLKAGEAREILEVFLGEDYGQEWDKWQSKLDEFLKENPEPSPSQKG